jgi:hypothetical protein
VEDRLHAVVALESGAQALDLARVAHAVEDHVRALAGEALRDPAPDAARGARDERGLPG